MIFKSKDTQHDLIPSKEYFKQYAIELAKETVENIIKEFDNE